MDLYGFLLKHFTYENAVMIKGVLTALSWFVLGWVLSLCYSTYVASLIRVDRNGLDKDGIGMLILKVGKKKRIIVTGNPGMRGLFRDLMIFSAYLLGIVKEGQVTTNDKKKANRLFIVFFIFVFLIFIASIHLAVDVMVRPEWIDFQDHLEKHMEEHLEDKILK